MKKIFLLFFLFSLSTFAQRTENIIKNGDFELGLTNWTASDPSTVTIQRTNTLNVLFGKQSLSFFPTSNGQYVKSVSTFVKAGQLNNQLKVSVRYLRGDENYRLEVKQGTTTLCSSPFRFTDIVGLSFRSEQNWCVFTAPNVQSSIDVIVTATGVVDNEIILDNFQIDFPENIKSGTVSHQMISAGKLTIGATTTAPTKATTTVEDYIQYARRGDEAHIVGGYKHTVATGAAAGSGDYLFSLPAGLRFDASKVKFYTSVISVSNVFTPISLGNFQASFSAFQVTGSIVPFDATRFRLCGLENDGGTPGNRGCMSNGMTPFNVAQFSISFDFFAPIEGWAATDSYVEQRCKSDADCDSKFTAISTSAGVITEDKYDWINGNCTKNTTGDFTCNFNTGYFSVTPECSAVPISTAVIWPRTYSVNTTSVRFIFQNTAGNTDPTDGFRIRCSKIGVDDKARRVIQASLQPMKVITATTIAQNGVYVIPHGLGRVPYLMTPFLVVNTSVGAWSVGDLIRFMPTISGTSESLQTIGADATNIYIYGGSGATVAIYNKATGAKTAEAITNFKVQVEFY